VRFVGRLAQFMYYDQDDVIRQALDTVSALGV
jgi:UDP-galactopyranose mutase